MPRIAPVTGKSDVPAEYHGVVDEVLKVFGGIRARSASCCTARNWLKAC